MSVTSSSLITGFTVQLFLSSVTHERKTEFRSCCWEELDEATSNSGDKRLKRDSTPASCCPGIIACWSSWPKGVGSSMFLKGSQNTYVTGRIHVERSVHRNNVLSKNKVWWKLHTMDYLTPLLRDRGCISLRHCIIQLSKFLIFCSHTPVVSTRI